MAARAGTALPDSCQTEDTAEEAFRLPLAASSPSPLQPWRDQPLCPMPLTPTSCRSPLFSVSRMMASASVVGCASTCSTITRREL